MVIFCENRCNVALRFRVRHRLPRRARPSRIKVDLDRGYMVDVLSVAMLVCASVASMAFGVFAAYGIFRVGFALMRPRRRGVTVKTQAEAAL